MREIFARMAELEREGRRFAVATVVRTTGSTPQVVGAKLLVDDLGRLVGTLGGGCVEGDAFVEAKRVIESGEPSLREYELTEDLAWDTGLVCGGTMWISIEPGERVLRFAGRDLLGDVLAASAGGKPVAVATLMRKRGKDVMAAGKLFVETDAKGGGTLGDNALDARARAAAIETLRQGTARSIVLDEETELLVEPVMSRPRLAIAGGGHVGLAIAMPGVRKSRAVPRRERGREHGHGQGARDHAHRMELIRDHRNAGAQARFALPPCRGQDRCALRRPSRKQAQDHPHRADAARRRNSRGPDPRGPRPGRAGPRW